MDEITPKSKFNAASPELKRDVLERLIRARADGVSTGRIVRHCGDGVSIHIIYNMLGAKSYPAEIWEAVDKGLEKIGY